TASPHARSTGRSGRSSPTAHASYARSWVEASTPANADRHSPAPCTTSEMPTSAARTPTAFDERPLTIAPRPPRRRQNAKADPSPDRNGDRPGGHDLADRPVDGRVPAPLEQPGQVAVGEQAAQSAVGVGEHDRPGPPADRPRAGEYGPDCVVGRRQSHLYPAA